jgi:hypothetical protein
VAAGTNIAGKIYMEYPGCEGNGDYLRKKVTRPHEFGVDVPTVFNESYSRSENLGPGLPASLEHVVLSLVFDAARPA